MLKSRLWIYFTAGVTLIMAAVVMADVGFHSAATEQTARQHAADSRRPDTIKTNPIYGSDAAISTYGVDRARTTDW